uniref:Uncharacterized protein n=1 Tax=Cannabis sativa TaxID=3483 RepID=A0A803P5F1_CANSA
MLSTAQLEANIEALTKDLNGLKDDRESLRTLLSNLAKEKQDLEESVKSGQVEWEALQKEVDNLETTTLEVIYEFWKANPNANFDYLNENKEAYLSFCAAQKDKEKFEAPNPTTLTVQNIDPLVVDDRVDPYKELRTPALTPQYFALFYKILILMH